MRVTEPPGKLTVKLGRYHSENISSEKHIQKLLGIPEKYRVLNIITIGYPETTRPGKPIDELQFEKIRLNKF